MNAETKSINFTREDAIGVLVTKYAQVLVKMCKKINPPRSTKFEQQEGFDDVVWMQEMITEAAGCVSENNYPLRAATRAIKWYFRKPNRVLAQVCLMDDIIAVLSEERDVFEAYEQNMESFRSAEAAKKDFKEVWSGFRELELECYGISKRMRGEKFIRIVFDMVLDVPDMMWNSVERAKIIWKAQTTLSEARRKLLFYAYGPRLNDEIMELYAPETIAKLSDEEPNLRAAIALRRAVVQHVGRHSDAEIAAAKDAGFNFRKGILMHFSNGNILELFATVANEVFSEEGFGKWKDEQLAEA